MRQRDMLFWIWLSERLGAGNRDFRKLISLYESPYDLYHTEDAELERIKALSPQTLKALADKDLQKATEILDLCEHIGIGILPYASSAYPKLLRELKAPPVLLYYRGKLPDFNARLLIGMVGTRSMSEYGMRTAYKISYELAAVGVVIVSGMAAGIDGVCAAGALAAKGDTVAVLGCGIDTVYPRHHKTLKREIERCGAVISEYPPGTRPNHYHFPTRNRLISGLSQGTVVVEAGIGSGSLITAKDAIVQGRDVFTVPANVGSRGAEGTNGLLRDGARPVLDVTDILETYQHTYAKQLSLDDLITARKRSGTDVEYLARMGVIELGEKAAEQAREAAQAKAELCEALPTVKKPQTKYATAARQKASAKSKTNVDPAPVSKQTHKTPDSVLSALTPIQLALLQAIPDDRAVTADSLGNLGYPYSEVCAALTYLEILGLIQKLPGALYTKC